MELLTTCPSCGNKDAVVGFTIRGEAVCDGCLSICRICRFPALSHAMPPEETYCTHCFMKHFDVCSCCNDVFHKDELTTFGNGLFCADCLSFKKQGDGLRGKRKAVRLIRGA